MFLDFFQLNDLIKRARLAKVHAYIISGLKKEMPSMFGKDAKKKELIKNLDNLYGQIQREHQISPGDFPDIKTMQEKLQHQDFTKFKLIDQRFLTKVINFFLEFPFVYFSCLFSESPFCLKFIYSEKATKFCEISTNYLTGST